MLVSEGRTFRFRAMARYKNSQERASIFAHVSKLPYNVALFDNTNAEHTLLADFDTRIQRDEFHARYNPPTTPKAPRTDTPILKLVGEIKGKAVITT